MAKTVDGVTTDYVLDPAAGLTQVLVESTGSQQTAYLYGHDLLAQYDSGTWAYHVNDGLGSVRGLADPTGQVVQGYRFSPFGVPLGESGGEPYGFTGEQWDASAGLVYLRARYYDPVTGRFITRDPYQGSSSRPQTQNAYTYALNNPVNDRDPLGATSEDEIERIWEETLQATGWPDDLSDFLLGFEWQYFKDVTLGIAPPDYIALQYDNNVAFLTGRYAARSITTFQGVFELGIGGLATADGLMKALAGAGITGLSAAAGGGLVPVTGGASVAVAAPPAAVGVGLVIEGGLEAAAGLGVCSHGALLLAYIAGNPLPPPPLPPSGGGGGNVQPRVSRPDGGYEKGMMADKEFEGVKKVADKWKRPIDICGGFAETERGLANRAANDASVPEWRRGELPTWTGDLDVSQATFEGLPSEQAAQLRADLLDVFKDAGVTTIDWEGYSTDLYPAGPMNPEGQPYGSIRFYPDGTTRRILAPWQ